MLYLRSLIRTFAFFATVIIAAPFHAQDGLGAAIEQVSSPCSLPGGLFGPSVVTADFNNDTYPDGAVLVRNRNNFRIEVHVRFQRVSRITFASNLPALSIQAVDVNDDGAPDLVVRDAFSHQRLFVWINDGYGSFHAASVIDYPAAGDERHRISGTPSQRPESRAMVAPCKMRVRQASPTSCRLPDSTGIARPDLRANLRPPVFASLPNLLRGPPTPSSL
jgi:FG-GAP-like repeat